MNIDDLIASARLAEDTVPICLRPDLLVAYKAAVAELERADQAQKANGSLAGGEKAAAQARVDELGEQMLAASITFTVRALVGKRWGELHAEHPPREGNEADASERVNRDTFYEALVRECVVDPQLTAEQWDALLPKLGPAAWLSLKNAAWLLNNTDVDVPFLLAASRAPTSTGPDSEQPVATESLSGDSTAGNPPPSTSTRATASSRPARSRSGTGSSSD